MTALSVVVPFEDSAASQEMSIVKKAAGTLYIVATPIGNLEDITLRALRILKEVDFIAAEDTRVTRKLLAHYDISATKLMSHHAHSGEVQLDMLLQKLIEGKSIALVSDAGTPLISDPGAEVVRACAEAEIRVEAVPGACAAICALITSGINAARFTFEGFLPRTNDRRERIAQIIREPRTVILYEAAPRLVDTLADIQNACVRDGNAPDRLIAVGREITKRFEETIRGSFDAVITHYTSNPPRGECVLVIAAGNSLPCVAESVDIDKLLLDALQNGLSPKDAARTVAVATGMGRNELYARLLAQREAASNIPES